jgi:hypothetical protein
MKDEKYPLGITPEWLHNEQRLSELDAAIKRYKFYDKVVPNEWVDEQLRLCAAILEHRNKSKSVPNKDWVVLTLKGDYGGHLDVEYKYNPYSNFYVPENHCITYGTPNWSLEDVINCHGGKITSVRRISDNEVFSIGDLILYDSGYYSLKIASFQILNNQMYLVNEANNLCTLISGAVKISQKFFTIGQIQEIHSIIESYLNNKQ